MKITSLKKKITQRVQDMNWLLNNEIATRQEIRDMRSRDGIALASASVSTGLESLRNLTALQQELDKVPGADSAQVQWRGADVSSESWIMRANKELHELKILIEGSQKQIEDRLDRKKRRHLGPANGKRLLVFIDDMNMPTVEAEGA